LTTPTNLIISNAYQTFEIFDGHGRRLTIRRINALDRLRLLKAAGPELSQNDAWLNMAALALSVLEVNGTPRVIPTNERQIEVMISELGDDGLQTVSDALTENDGAAMLFEGPPEGNAAGTPI
jgi:hypothetical protein